LSREKADFSGGIKRKAKNLDLNKHHRSEQRSELTSLNVSAVESDAQIQYGQVEPVF
jgi:hypothetical protein